MSSHIHHCVKCASSDIVWPRDARKADPAYGAYWAQHQRIRSAVRRLERLDEVLPEDPSSPAAREMRQLAGDHYDRVLRLRCDADLAHDVALLLDLVRSLRGADAVRAYSTIFEHWRRHFPTY